MGLAIGKDDITQLGGELDKGVAALRQAGLDNVASLLEKLGSVEDDAVADFKALIDHAIEQVKLEVVAPLLQRVDSLDNKLGVLMRDGVILGPLPIKIGSGS